MNRVLSVCAVLCLTVIPAAVKADITAPIVYLEHATPSVSLKINGKKVNRLAIDTGVSGGFYLPQSVFDSIFPARNHRTETQNSVDIFGVEKSAVAARAANITVNGERLSDVDVEIFKPWGNGMLDSNGQLIIDGVLGLGIAKNKTLIINYASKMLTITDHLKALPDGYRWQSIPFTRTRSGIEISVLSGNEKISRMVIDTGASHTILFTRSKKGCAVLSASCPKQTIVTPDGVRLSAFIFQVSDDKINPDKRIDFDGLLGEDFLSNRVLVISNDRLLISSPNNS
ncbi:aspartyl protease family protein [Xenorhabdus lircayensis]|uniref:Aspartyl protease family protein n=1 Tax=Xenorhabdus lircayensis TaxID=2763499 RepID=A0ABS0U6C4_9GAMM|nr:aspartyl protease family protein [Xenorhabdus lircayensis]MBI6549432.1 aspartyl protease family protein [Xenorhabdus lircayensis]